MKLYGLIGYPLSHSFSQKYFTEKFLKENILEIEYRNFPLKSINELNALLKLEPNLEGFNVTIPYKEQIIPFLHEMDEVAKEIGAVNTVRINRLPNGTAILKGFNTDVYGFKQSLQPLLCGNEKKALILGTGGASKAVTYVIKNLGISYTLVSRNASSQKNRIDYHSLTREMITENDIIINTTPLGTYPNIDEFPPINYAYLSPKHILVDLIYNPDKTVFLRNGEAKGARISNGYKMLCLQAEKAWEIWRA